MLDPFELAEAPGPGLAPPIPHLDGLNETQRDAVETVDGPLLVLAGAGTGKTRVLTTRLAHILSSGRARSWQVLAVTFTNKAAREMRERVAGLLNAPIEGWWVGTFHAVGARILRAHPEQVGLKPNFTILDTDDQLRLIKQFLEAHNIDTKRTPLRLISAVIQRWKDRGLTPDRVSDAEGADAVDGKALRIYREYQERLRTLNAADFGDLLLHCLTLFQANTTVLERYQNQFRYILVDEYQDTNVAQYLWLRALAQVHRNICCVGDDDQSIYSWRGAEVGNILRFEKDFPGARIIRLERNYRSTPHILGAASGVIANNQSRLGKTLWTDLDEGEKLVIRSVWDGEDEARNVCDEVESLQRQGNKLSNMAVLVRAGFQTREFEERMITVGIPYKVVGGMRFYERQEIRDAIAYLRAVVQSDDDLAFERIVNVPKRGLGAACLRGIHLLARSQGGSLMAAASQLVETDEMKPSQRKTVRGLLEDFQRWRGLVETLSPSEVARVVLDESGYTQMWQRDPSPDAAGRLENLKELVAALGEFETLAGFLEHVSLVMDNDDSSSDDKVTLMTLHSAKGLEFDTVFLPGWEEGLFPHQRALDEGGLAALEEERRLAYVGITRARKRARISYASSRLVYGNWQSAIPSRFVDEIPDEHADHILPRGMAVGGMPLAQDAGSVAWPAASRGGSGSWPRRAKAPMIEGLAQKVAERPAPSHGIATGQRVFHQKFGYGHVRAVDGDKLEVSFDKAGTKKVIQSFVEAV